MGRALTSPHSPSSEGRGRGGVVTLDPGLCSPDDAAQSAALSPQHHVPEGKGGGWGGLNFPPEPRCHRTAAGPPRTAHGAAGSHVHTAPSAPPEAEHHPHPRAHPTPAPCVPPPTPATCRPPRPGAARAAIKERRNKALWEMQSSIQSPKNAPSRPPAPPPTPLRPPPRHRPLRRAPTPGPRSGAGPQGRLV